MQFATSEPRSTGKWASPSMAAKTATFCVIPAGDLSSAQVSRRRGEGLR